MPNIKTGRDIFCKTCNKKFYVALFNLKKNKKYCSWKCYQKDNIPWNKGLTKKDDPRLMSVSKKSSEQMYREYADGTRDKNEIVKKAHEAVREKSLERFKTNPNRMISKRGYWMIYVPLRGWVKEHHYIWEQAGRIIPEGHHLHHINGDKLDNRLVNLQLLTSSEHRKKHPIERNELGRFKSR